MGWINYSNLIRNGLTSSALVSPFSAGVFSSDSASGFSSSFFSSGLAFSTSLAFFPLAGAFCDVPENTRLGLPVTHAKSNNVYFANQFTFGLGSDFGVWGFCKTEVSVSHVHHEKLIVWIQGGTDKTNLHLEVSQTVFWAVWWGQDKKAITNENKHQVSRVVCKICVLYV